MTIAQLLSGFTTIVQSSSDLYTEDTDCYFPLLPQLLIVSNDQQFSLNITKWVDMRCQFILDTHSHDAMITALRMCLELPHQPAFYGLFPKPTWKITIAYGEEICSQVMAINPLLHQQYDNLLNSLTHSAHINDLATTLCNPQLNFGQTWLMLNALLRSYVLLPSTYLLEDFLLPILCEMLNLLTAIHPNRIAPQPLNELQDQWPPSVCLQRLHTALAAEHIAASPPTSHSLNAFFASPHDPDTAERASIHDGENHRPQTPANNPLARSESAEHRAECNGDTPFDLHIGIDHLAAVGEAIASPANHLDRLASHTNTP